MIDTELADLVKSCLYTVAPDIEGEPIDPEKSFRAQFEIDSMDFLNFVIGLHKATGVEILERDYPSLQTLSGAVAFLRQGSP
ncbi:acyl carrier protein [Ensifer adhaerens]|uniref:acyl carrier protein n=1 Tax=Ensifer canadensis TaxID=555315 RepID=UPI00148FA9A8|nr:acyl carrier protein [Ensifer canadensis]NOV16998.1 acyl carrier protein [Ensifer canadensis]